MRNMKIDIAWDNFISYITLAVIMAMPIVLLGLVIFGVLLLIEWSVR